MSANKPNYLDLTEEQKQYIRDNAGRITVETIVKNLYYTSRHNVVTFMIAEKLTFHVKKQYKKKEKDIWDRMWV